MMRGWMIIVLICCGLAFHTGPCLAANANLFDRPLREQYLTLPPPNPDGHSRVSCYYYAGFMVKEVMLEGLKGADQLSVLSIPKDAPEPACRRENAADEQVIQNWSGSFLGVRRSYVFFSGAEGGAFMVYDGTQTLFSDAADTLLSVEPLLPPRDPESRPWYYDPLLLKYHKVYVAPCSMRSDAVTCWALIRRTTGLRQVAPPKCDAAYAAEEKAAPAEQRADLRRDPSIIVYAVETLLDGQGVIRLTPTSPVLKCYPAP